MKYNLISLNTNKLDWMPEHGAFVSEMSDLPSTILFQRVYDDAADRGFILESARTGRTKLFTLYSEVINNDGELVKYEFRSECGLKVIVFND